MISLRQICIPAPHNVAPIDLLNKHLAFWALLPSTLLSELLHEGGTRPLSAVVLAAVILAPIHAARGAHRVAADRAECHDRRLATCGLEHHPALAVRAVGAPVLRDGALGEAVTPAAERGEVNGFLALLGVQDEAAVFPTKLPARRVRARDRHLAGVDPALNVHGHALHAEPVLALHAVEEVQDREGLCADTARELGQFIVGKRWHPGRPHRRRAGLVDVKIFKREETQSLGGLLLVAWRLCLEIRYLIESARLLLHLLHPLGFAADGLVPAVVVLFFLHAGEDDLGGRGAIAEHSLPCRDDGICPVLPCFQTDGY